MNDGQPKPGSFEEAQYLAFKAGIRASVAVVRSGIPAVDWSERLMLEAFERWRADQVPTFTNEGRPT